MSLVCNRMSSVCHPYIVAYNGMSFVCTRMSSVYHLCVLIFHTYVNRMSFVCHLHVLVCHSYVTRLSSYVILLSPVCTCMSSVCHLRVLVCHTYVTRAYWYAIRISLVCTRMSSICHLYVLVYHPYVTRMWFCSTRVYKSLHFPILLWNQFLVFLRFSALCWTKFEKTFINLWHLHCIFNNQLQWQIKSNFHEFALLLELKFTHLFSKKHSSTTNCVYVQFFHGFFFWSLTCFLSYDIAQSVR